MEQHHTTEDVDDIFRALLEGLRTTLPGVQVLFAFLLILPFRSEFTDLHQSLHLVFYVAFGASAIASVLLIAPSVHQRVRAPVSGVRRRTRRHVMVAVWIALVGTTAAAVAVSAVTYLVSHVVFGSAVAAVATTAVAVLTTWSWFVVPLVDFSREDGEDV